MPTTPPKVAKADHLQELVNDFEGIDEFMLEPMEDHEATESAREENAELSRAREMAGDIFNPPESDTKHPEDEPLAATLASAARVRASLPPAISNTLASSVEATSMPLPG